MLWPVLVVVCVLGSATRACVREPKEEHSTALRSPGDNGFHIQVSGEPERYVPGAVYTCEFVAVVCPEIALIIRVYRNNLNSLYTPYIH
jgi:hypothetical protein